jgi:uncharacterized cupredoxin-like copper-binding protein
MRLPLCLMIGCLCAFIGLQAVSSAFAAESLEEETALIIMRGREFLPERILVHQGRKTRLRLHNQDSELHAFVPVGLFTGASFNISGNGAPEFGPDGLKRILLPADGLTDLRFIPTRPGEYRYFCDMPGHQMNAVIVVE